MSAIFGLTLLQPQDSALDSALAQLDHWNGPYGSEAAQVRVLGRSGLGCRVEHFSDRFPFGGPILSDGPEYAVIDALLYNRDELLPLLGLPVEEAISDEALLWRLLRERGYESLAQVNGDFAGAVYDAAEERWTLFRDHLGVRPLYYYQDGPQMAFSTDLRGLVSLAGERCRPNPRQVYKLFLGYNSLTLTETDYENIRCVMPGAFLQVECRGGFALREQTYWKPRQKKIRMESEAAYTAELRRLIWDSVRRRSDAIPGILGAELSGGLDSSVISIILHRLGREAVHYSWSEELQTLPLREGEDERKVILDICRQEGIDCKFTGKGDHFSVEDHLERVDPPYTNTFALTFGSRYMHSRGARVVFTGHGGDEGVSHRTNAYELLANGELLPYWRLYRRAFKGRLGFLRAVKWAALEGYRNWKANLIPFRMTHGDERILSDAFRTEMGAVVVPKKLQFAISPHRYVMDGGTRSRLDNAAYQGACAGVRYLFPYVDHRVMDFALSIPRHLYLSNGSDRKIFREAFRDIIPASLRKVRYKDYASQRDRKPTEKQMKDYAASFAMTDKLDREYWKGILNLEHLPRVQLPESMEDPVYDSFVQLYVQLLRCLMTQNVCEKTKQWRDAHGL